MSRMDTIQPNDTTGRLPRVHRGRNSPSPKSGEANHEAPSTDLAITLDHVIEPPAGQLRLSSTDLVITLDHVMEPPAGQLCRSSRHPLRARKYVVEHRARKANKRESSIPGMKIKDPVSIVKLRLTKSEMDQVIEASRVLAVHERDDKKILTPREDRDWIAELAHGLLLDLFRERLKGRK
jgi:hypothetical protein